VFFCLGIGRLTKLNKIRVNFGLCNESNQNLITGCGFRRLSRISKEQGEYRQRSGAKRRGAGDDHAHKRRG
jgi:hypothetical protein